VSAHQHQLFILDIPKHVNSPIQITFDVQAYAQATLYVIGIDCSVDIAVTVVLSGQQAHARVFGLYALRETQSIQFSTRQEHQNSHTSSSVVVHGILAQHARAHYQGTIYVAEHAHKSNATQQNKHMLFGSHAQATSTPSLEVLTNDVQCKHGSAVGRFAEQQLFYLLSRGLQPEQAQQLLLQSFFSQIVAGLSDAVVSDINERIFKQF
jgi:Fe-S cluster assembly protein SufD